MPIWNAERHMQGIEQIETSIADVYSMYVQGCHASYREWTTNCAVIPVNRYRSRLTPLAGGARYDVSTGLRMCRKRRPAAFVEINV